VSHLGNGGSSIIVVAGKAMATFRFTVNGKAHTVNTEPDRPLLEVLREDLGLTGSKYGCGEGQCRACTVLMDGRAVVTCVMPVRNAEGRKITTIEGLAPSGDLHPVQKAFIERDALQCGYCTSGMILTAAALLQRTPQPTEAQVVEGLNGNLCRCTGYPAIVAAVRYAAQLSQGASRG
jgi:aerobic-type carbon monoxide dehydrogenase small subunit (CoxS/CutS family)